MTDLLGVLYGCQIGLNTLGEEHRLRVSVNRMLRRIFGSERVGGGIKLYNEELHDVCFELNIIRMSTPWRMQWVEYVGWAM